MSDTIISEVAGEIRETVKRVPKEVAKINPGEMWKALLTGETTGQNPKELEKADKKKVGKEAARLKAIIAEEKKKSELPIYYQNLKEEQEKALRRREAAEKELPAPKTTSKPRGMPFSTVKMKEGTEGRVKNVVAG